MSFSSIWLLTEQGVLLRQLASQLKIFKFLPDREKLFFQNKKQNEKADLTDQTFSALFIVAHVPRVRARPMELLLN